MQTEQPAKRSQTYMSTIKHLKYEHFVSGVSGGVVATVILHPLDLLKIRFAVNDGQSTVRPQYTGLVNACKTILRTEGIRGLYRGVTPNVWGAGSSWGLYFLFYNSIKGWMQDRELNGGPHKSLGPVKHMAAGLQAGVITLALLNPVWVIKTRLCLQYSSVDVLPPSRCYSGMMDALVKLYKYEGVAGMYKGFVPGLFGTTHGALQFMAYEELKTKLLEYRGQPNDTKLGTAEYIACAATSKLFAVVVTYPYQVVRARLQDQLQKYNGVVDVLKKTWRYEGIKGLYRGFNPYLLHVTPNVCLVFLISEHIVHKFRRPEDS